MKDNKELKNYFKEARTWADDNFARIEVSRNRYQTAFLAAMLFNACAGIAIIILAPMQTLMPLLVHHYDNGITTVDPLYQTNAPINKAQVESDIARYITNRESYDLHSYRAQFDLVSLLSNANVNDGYLREQDKSNPSSPVNHLKENGSRAVHIYSINFLDNLMFNEKDIPKNHQNAAEVVFTITDTEKESGSQTKEHYNALISWRYTEPSKDPSIRWLNWDGFQVIRYSKQLRNV